MTAKQESEKIIARAGRVKNNFHLAHDTYLEFLNKAAAMPQYSAGTLLQIQSQNWETRDVRTQREWYDEGRAILPKQTPIRIIAPTGRLNDKGTPEFAPTSVYDIQQTQGEPIEERENPMIDQNGDLTQLGTAVLQRVADSYGNKQDLSKLPDMQRVQTICELLTQENKADKAGMVETATYVAATQMGMNTQGYNMYQSVQWGTHASMHAINTAISNARKVSGLATLQVELELIADKTIKPAEHTAQKPKEEPPKKNDKKRNGPER